MKKKFVIRKIMIGRESLYLYKGEYGNTFGYGINQVYEIKQFDAKEEAESIISQLGDGMYEIVEVYIK
ncbi:hypothetical protein [Parabacteroides sp. AM08-6]|uniref:hypothetical protein n=1 Tax=Parabacteroides sp. AM08-6 TaxID=2292053 RepID=UPI000FF4FC06|nr:hypothetical protein [Parabacteroides sp. AM08-6]RHJ76891.1 hypothetical protein DW103_16440 [Parabacteroides sp. AM08-6]